MSLDEAPRLSIGNAILGELSARILVIIGGKLGPGSDLQKRDQGVGEAADPGRGQAVTRAEQ